MIRKSAQTLLALALASALLGCVSDTVTVGVILPLTGDQATYGVPIRQGIEVAFEEIKRISDYPHQLQLEVVDSGGDPERAQELLEELYGNGAIAVIGGATSGEAMQMIPVADRFDRLLLSPSATAPELTGISTNFFRVVPSDFRQASKMANFATQTLEIKSVVAFAEAQPFAKGIQEVFQQEFERYGGEVLEVLEFPPNTLDVSGFVERVETLKPNAVYLAAYETGTESMIHALRDAGFTGRILTTHAFAKPSAIVRTGEDAVGVILTQSVFEIDSEHAHVKTFIEEYREKYGEDPDLFAAHGYDAMKVLAEAMRERPPLGSEIPMGMRGIENFQGVTGSVQFDEKGDVQQYPRVYVVREDLTLNDYDSYVTQQRDEIMERLKQLRREAKSMRQDEEN